MSNFDMIVEALCMVVGVLMGLIVGAFIFFSLHGWILK